MNKYPCPRWENHRHPRINGDTRRRKRRLRKKLAKIDAVIYAPAIAEANRCIIKDIERVLFDKIDPYMWIGTPAGVRAYVFE